MTNTLRVRRAERRLSQMALARAAGIAENRYWRVENGFASPTDAERAALASALGVSVDVVFPSSSDLAVSA